METGESFQIAIKPENDCYCYVISRDSDENILVLKNTFLQGGTEVKTNPPIIQITEPSGTEMVYVIMSLNRLTQLESLINSFNSNRRLQQNANNLYNEVVKLQNEAAERGEPPSAFIIPSGGTSRGVSDEYTNRFTDKNLYVRTITIRH